jgi:predicted  nucleic acid-binding Zn-ribbon protein
MSMEKLINLQGIDTKLKDLNDLLGDLPSKVNELNQQEDSIKNSIIEDKERLKVLEVESHKGEVRIAEINGKINKLKDQLFLVTNNKQYDALMNEMDHMKDERSTIELQTLSYMEEKETLAESVETMESDLGSLSNDLTGRREKLEKVISNSANEKSSLEKNRAIELDGIDLNIISIYNRVFDARDGLAVVNLSGNGCGGCGAHVPMQKVTEIRSLSAIHRCDVCGRFLYSENNSVN